MLRRLNEVRDTIIKSNQCKFFGLTENHDNESILIFHSCSTSDLVEWNTAVTCGELNTGLTPRSVMTKGISNGKGRHTHIIWPIFYQPRKFFILVDAIIAL